MSVVLGIGIGVAVAAAYLIGYLAHELDTQGVTATLDAWRARDLYDQDREQRRNLAPVEDHEDGGAA